MPKETFLHRFSLIIKRLEKGPATYEQIAEYLENDPTMHDKSITISRRTLQRDIKDIYSQMKYEIENEKKGDNRYFIKGRPEDQEHSHRLLEAYGMVNILKAFQDNSQHIYFEARKPKGLEHFNGLLHAVKNRKITTITYYEFWEEIVREHIVHPLALKEAKGRWYLVAFDKTNGKVKNFGLDRIDDLEISKTSFRDKYDVNINELFLHSFGIINNEDKKPQTIRLSFAYEQGQYVKAYPLHHSQKLIQEDEEVVIELYLRITYDFIMELLSFGEKVTVLSPKLLVTELKNSYRKTLSKYN